MQADRDGAPVLDTNLDLVAAQQEAFTTVRDDGRMQEGFVRGLSGDVPAMESAAGAIVRWPMVSMQEFIDEPFFLGLKGRVWPRVMDVLLAIEAGNYTEVILTGGIGWGKSYVADILLLRMVYEASCLTNPQRAYGLTEGFPVVFVMQSLTERLAKKVLFEGAAALLRKSPFFREFFPPDAKVKSELRFPGGIRIEPVAGNEGASIGMNVMGAIMDEANFMAIIANSKRRPWEDVYDVAMANYLSLSRRLKSRFVRRGRLAGRLVLVSSKRYADDFTERRIAQAKAEADPSVYVADFATWETKPAGTYDPGQGTFRIYVAANALERSRILDSAEPAPGDGEVVEAPTFYRPDFDRDIEASLREIAGRTTPVVNRFFRRGDVLEAAVTTDFAHPLTRMTTNLRDDVALLPERLHQDVDAPRAVHLDLGVKHDACGVAIGYVSGVQEVERSAIDVARLDDDQTAYDIVERDGRKVYLTMLPVITFELLLQVTPPPGDVILIPEVIELLLKIRQHVPIAWATADSFQSVAPLQMLRAEGIATDVLSVDVKPHPYYELRSALYERRVRMYRYAPAMEEILALERNDKTGRIDHPQWMSNTKGERVRGRKDVADGMAGVSAVLMSRRESWGERVVLRRERGSIQRVSLARR